MRTPKNGNLGRVGMWAAGLLLLAAGAASAAETRDAQKCLNAMGKAGISVRKTQAKEISTCIKEFIGSGGHEVGTCVVGDPDGKVAKAVAKIQTTFDKSCTMDTPTFGLTSPAVIETATAGVDSASVLLLTDLFSSESAFDLALNLDCNTGQDRCDCQRVVFEEAQKTTKTMDSLWLKCKKSALKDGAASREDLARCLTDPTVGLSVAADTKGKLAKGFANLAGKYADKCLGFAEFEGPFDFGLCEEISDQPTCIAERTRCRFCEMVSDMDDLHANCDLWDDEIDNDSCRPISCDASPDDVANGGYAACTDTASGGTCALTCDAGYSPSGDGLNDCYDNGWTDAQLCSPSACIQPANPANGSYATCDPTASGGTCELTCDAGFVRSGDGSNNCSFGSWIDNQTCTGPKYAFIGSLHFRSDLGVAHADGLCKSEADASVYAGGVLNGRNWVAFLSTSTLNASDRVANAVFRLPNGVRIADDKNDLLNGSLDAAINVGADGSTGISALPGTGSNANGTYSGVNCNDWSTLVGTRTAGYSQATNSTWANYTAGSCNAATMFVYCFEQ
jgi:hypothetical protein